MKDKTKISFTGDVMVEHTRLESYESDGKYDFTELFLSCKELFGESDYVVANLETPVAGERMEYSYKDYNFNTPETILEAMKSVGIDMVTTANNHVLDRGVAGIDKTIENIEENGLDYTGITKTGEMPRPLIKVINGIKIGFLSYTYGTEACYNMHYLKKREQYRVNLLKNQELYNPIQRFIVRSSSLLAICIRKALIIFRPSFFKNSIEDYPQYEKCHRKHIRSDVQYCKKNECDLVVMCLHSGGQFNDKPTEYTKEISQFCKDVGVDVVVGNHEHRIQYFNVEKEIAYCLGNYTSNYGIERKPFDSNAECSILLHMYIDEKLRREYTFSILISKKNDDEKIITVPLYDEYIKSIETMDEKKRKYLINANTYAYNSICGTNYENMAPEKEYECLQRGKV